MKVSYLRKVFLLFILVAGLVSCSNNSGGNTDDDPITPSTILPPSSSTLIFPEDDTECNTGAVVNATQSNVTFEWNVSENTDIYELTLTNLNTNNFSRASSSANEITLLIERGVPYEWFVTSIGNETDETATSDIWRFYNEGQGIENYAPFPAEAINPKRGENISTSLVTLEWEGSDVDDDITNYEVLFGSEINPSTSLGQTSETSIENIDVMANNTYYWQVISTDSRANTSNSEIFTFRVN